MATSKSPATGKTAKAGKKQARPAAATDAPGKITPKQALANTLALLKAKKDKTRQPANYPTGGAAHPGSNGPHGSNAARTETAPAQRSTEAIHALATETGDESRRSQS